jgi:hypothetical protein
VKVYVVELARKELGKLVARGVDQRATRVALARAARFDLCVERFETPLIPARRDAECDLLCHASRQRISSRSTSMLGSYTSPLP